MGLIQFVKDIKENRHYNQLAEQIAALEEANIPEINELNEKWNNLKKKISKDTEKIEKKEEQYRKGIKDERNNKKKIKKCKNKMKDLRKVPLLSRAFLNVAQLWGNERAVEYASYKRSIKNSKDKITTIRGERSQLQSELNKKLSENEQNKAEFKAIEKKISEKYTQIKGDLDNIIFYENNKEELAKIWSKGTMKDMEVFIQNVKEGKSAPEVIVPGKRTLPKNKAQLFDQMKKAIEDKDNAENEQEEKNKDNSENEQEEKNKDNAKNQHEEKNKDNSKNQHEEKKNNKKITPFVQNLKDWPAVAFTKYQIDRNKLEQALKIGMQGYKSLQDPVEYACHLGKLHLGDKAKDLSKQELADRGLKILKDVIEGNENSSSKAYTIAKNFMKHAPEIRMDSAIPDQDHTQTKDAKDMELAE